MSSMFDKEVNRRGTGSMKWNVGEYELPMWVADMDFETAPAVTKAIMDRAVQGIYGYTEVSEEWYLAYQNWWQDRHHFPIEKDWLIFCTGVVPAISSIVRKMTTVAEKIVVMTPCYNIFFNSIVNNGRNVLESRLHYEDGVYSIDQEDLEEKLADPQTSMLILCNPHNPVGKIWDRETLERIGELCFKHHVLVLSDEIHCDITRPGMEYIPFASVSEHCKNNSITCVAPTKTFNLAGLQTAAVIVPDAALRHRVNRGLNTDEVAEPNVFAVDAAIAAFTRGESWLDALREYIAENKKQVVAFLEKEIKEITVVPSEATYLLWLDCSRITDDTKTFARFLREQTGLYVSAGAQYGGDGNKFLRMNIACPRATLEDGLTRLQQGVFAYRKTK